MVKYGSAAALDAALDADPCLCHKYIEQADTLIQHKKENPTMRMGKHNDLQKDSVEIHEEKRQGLKKPKRKFMTGEAFEKRFGAADPSKIKQQKVDGETIRGLDVIAEEDIGVYEYIDENVNTIQRCTMLSDGDVVLSAEQNDIVFNAAAKHMSTTPKDDAACTVVSGSTASSASGSGPCGVGAKDAGGADQNTDQEDC